MKGISSYHIKYSTDLAVVKIGGGLPLRYPFFMIAKLPNRAYLGDLIIRGLRASFRRPEAIRRFQAVLPLVAPSEDRRLLGRWREKALMTYCTKDYAAKWRQLYEHFFKLRSSITRNLLFYLSPPGYPLRPLCAPSIKSF